MTSALTAPVRGCEVARPLMVESHAAARPSCCQLAHPAAARSPSPARRPRHAQAGPEAQVLSQMQHDPRDASHLWAAELPQVMVIIPAGQSLWQSFAGAELAASPRPRRPGPAPSPAPPRRHSPAFTADLKFLRR